MTPEEINNFDTRLQTLEIRIVPMVESLRNRINAYDKLIAECEELSRTFSNLYSSHDNLKNIVSIISSDLKLVKPQIVNIHEQSDIRYDLHKQVISDLESKLGELKESVDFVSDQSDLKYDDLRKDLSDKINLKSDKSLVDGVYSDLKMFLCDLEHRLVVHQQNFNSFKEKVSNELSAVLDASVSMSGYKKDQESFRVDMDDLKSQISVIRNSRTTDLEAHKAKVSQDIQALKDSFSSLPDPTESLRTEFTKKLEGVSLDAKNAALRTQNSDQKIVLVEKKIENINLLLKKYELDK